jgi:NAD dependent epimerase/dehydratase family enzyme
MKVLVSGSKGLVGSALIAHLKAKGDQVLRLVRERDAVESDCVFWNPAEGRIDAAELTRPLRNR